MNRAIALFAAMLALAIVTPSIAQEAPAAVADEPAQAGDDFHLTLDAIAEQLRNEEHAREPAEGAAVQGEVVSLADRVSALMQRHMRQCWSPPDLSDSTVVTLTFDLSRDGTLDGSPKVISPRGYMFDPNARRAAEAAQNAIAACTPFPFATDPVVADHYDLWREMELRFDSRNYDRAPSPASR